MIKNFLIISVKYIAFQPAFLRLAKRPFPDPNLFSAYRLNIAKLSKKNIFSKDKKDMFEFRKGRYEYLIDNFNKSLGREIESTLKLRTGDLSRTIEAAQQDLQKEAKQAKLAAAQTDLEKQIAQNMTRPRHAAFKKP